MRTNSLIENRIALEKITLTEAIKALKTAKTSERLSECDHTYIANNLG